MSIPDLAAMTAEPAPRFANLESWLSWQEKLHFTSIDLGLDRCRSVAKRMSLFPPVYCVISIAGTNGKGSSGLMLENILSKAGYKVGLYSSPHLHRYNERIKLGGQEISDEELCESFARIDRARGEISLTYFEFGTLAAMDLFQSKAVDIAIMEVGMGGRLDAVNMLDANVALLSTIDVDHEQWLGADRESIGKEKAGIFRCGKPAICADPEPPLSVPQTANLVGANLLRSGIDFIHEISGQSWSWRSDELEYQKLPIPGNLIYQVQNAAGVLMALQVISKEFPVQPEIIIRALEDFRFAGRFQVIPGDIPLILDVAHNRQSAAALAENIRSLPHSGDNILILGMLKDKNHEALIRELTDCIDKWYLISLAGSRGADASELASVLGSVTADADMTICLDIDQALSAARTSAVSGDRIIIAGSFLTVSQALNLPGIEK